MFHSPLLFFRKILRMTLSLNTQNRLAIPTGKLKRNEKDQRDRDEGMLLKMLVYQTTMTMMTRKMTTTTTMMMMIMSQRMKKEKKVLLATNLVVVATLIMVGKKRAGGGKNEIGIKTMTNQRKITYLRKKIRKHQKVMRLIEKTTILIMKLL